MLIEFGILSYKLLIPLLYPIFHIIAKNVNYYDFIKNSPLLDSFIRSTSYLLGGLVYLIVFYRSRNIKKSSTSKNSQGKSKDVYLIYEDSENVINQIKPRKKKLISLFLLSLINLIPIIINKIFLKLELIKELEESIGLTIIFFYVIFSKLILKSKIYRHHIISIIMISFCMIILVTIDINRFQKEEKEIEVLVKSSLYFITFYIFFALYDVLVKKHFEVHFTDPYYLMFFIGFFSLLLVIPLNLFLYFFDNKEILGLDIISRIQNLYKEIPLFLLKFIFNIILQFFWLGGIILIIYYFTPCHFIICRVLSEFSNRCIEWPKKNNEDKWYFIIIYIVVYFIMIFFSLVYNEVIIINLWNMEENTNKYITFRGRIESNHSLKVYEENLNNLNAELPINNEEAESDEGET